MLPLTLTPDELQALTGYRQPVRQLAELHRQGFYRARRSVLGGVVLERAHYDAVSAGREAQAPANQPQLRPPRLRAA
jgi:hypothetical protein